MKSLIALIERIEQEFPAPEPKRPLTPTEIAEWIMFYRALFPYDDTDSPIVREMNERHLADYEPSLRVFMEKLRQLSERFIDAMGMEQLVIAVETARERSEPLEIDAYQSP